MESPRFRSGAFHGARDPRQSAGTLADFGPKTLDDIVLCEILRCGMYNDAATIPELKQFYCKYFLPVPVERRSQVYGHVAGMVENVDFVSPNAFLPASLLPKTTG